MAWKIKALPSKLGTGNSGPLGIEHSPGVQCMGEPTQEACPRMGASLVPKQSLIHEEDAPKGGNHGTHGDCIGFLFLMPKGMRSVETSQQVYSSPQLQDRGNVNPEGLVDKG